MAITMIGRYAELTGGAPTPGPEPWPAAVARIAGIVPAAMAGDTKWLPSLYPQGLAAIALGTYIIAAEGARPPSQVTVSQVQDALRDPSGDPPWGPSASQGYAVRSWGARLAALGHDPDAGIRRPAWCEGLNGAPGYILTCSEDVRLAYGRGPEGPATRLADPVAAVWLMLRQDTAPAGDTGMDDTSFIRTGAMLVNAVGPALAALRRHGAGTDWQPPQRPAR